MHCFVLVFTDGPSLGGLISTIVCCRLSPQLLIETCKLFSLDGRSNNSTGQLVLTVQLFLAHCLDEDVVRRLDYLSRWVLTQILLY